MRESIGSYLNRLAAKSPVPGGGSASALTGAAGVSLLSMTARYMAGKAGRGALAAKLNRTLRFTAAAQKRLQRLMVEDEKAYLRLYKGLKKRSLKDIKELYKRAADVPMEVCGILQEGLKQCVQLSAHCKTSIASDLVQAAILMKAGFLSAKVNVDANLKGLRKYVKHNRR